MNRVYDIDAPLGRAEIGGIITAIMMTGSAALGWGYCAPLVSQNIERMTGSGAILGWLIAIGAVTSVLVTPFLPKLLSKYNPRSIMMWSLIVGSLAIPFFKIFMHPAAWFLIKFIVGCAFTIVFVSAETWINQLAPEKLRGRILGLYGTALAGSFGIGSAFAVFTGIDGWFPYLFGMTLNLLGLIPFFMFRKVINIVPPPREHAGLSSIFKIMLAAPSIITCGIVFGALEQGMFHILPVYGTRLLGSEHWARILLLVATVGNALFQYPMGMLVDRVDRRKLMTSLMACAFIGPLLMILAGSNFMVLAVIAFFYVGLTTALYTVGLVLLAQRFKGNLMAAANAAFIFAYGIGSLVVPPIAGFMMDIIVPYGFLWTMAGLGAVGFVIIGARSQRIKPAFDAS